MKLKSIGADPEFFVRQYAGLDISTGLIGGAKHAARQLSHGAAQEDNVAVELNVIPATSEEEWVSNITLLFNEVNELLNPKHWMEVRACAYFTKEQLLKGGAATMRFGCDPSYNVWTGDQNRPPRAPADGLRTASGDIHVSFDAVNYNNTIMMVKAMELYLGVPSVMIDNNAERRKLYGQSGNFRPKEYGIEYKVLSNQWLTSEERMRWAFRNTATACSNAEAADTMIAAVGGPETIQRTINECDTDKAHEICTTLGIEVPS